MRFIKGDPLTHEDAHVRLLCIAHAIVSQRSLRILYPPLTCLCVSHPFVSQVAQTYLCCSPYSTNYHTLSVPAHEVMTLNAIQFSTLSILEGVDVVSEQSFQRIRSRRTTPENFKTSASLANPTVVYLGYHPLIEKADQFSQRFCPSYLAVRNNDSGV